MPATAATRPPAIAGPRLRNFSCAKTSLGFSTAAALAPVAARAVVAELTASSAAAAPIRKEYRLIVRSPGNAGVRWLTASCTGQRTLLIQWIGRNRPNRTPVPLGRNHPPVLRA